MSHTHRLLRGRLKHLVEPVEYPLVIEGSRRAFTVAAGSLRCREMYQSLGHVDSLQKLLRAGGDRVSLRCCEERRTGDLTRYRRQLVVEHRREVVEQVVDAVHPQAPLEEPPAQHGLTLRTP